MIRNILCFVIDVGLKFGLGIAIVTIVWLPFKFFSGSAYYPWAIAGLILGLLLNGLWELSDVFGLKKKLKIKD